MKPFVYLRPRSVDDAIRSGRKAGAMFLAGGTSLVDLAKCGVAAPDTLVDLTYLAGLDDIQVGERNLSIGALAKMSTVAGHPEVKRLCPAVSEALLSSASAQIRNMATIGGNLLQRTRCSYFRDPRAFPFCNKRNPGSGCDARGGATHNHAILGTSEACFAPHPSDLAVVLVALDTVIHVGARSVSAEEFFLLPGATPEKEHALAPGELITSVTIPRLEVARRSSYLKIRHRQSYEFAAVSAAVALDLAPDGVTVRDIRIALGGIGTKPWRARNVESALVGRKLDQARLTEASHLAVEGAVSQEDNHYKIELAPRVLVRAIMSLKDAG